MNGIHDLGGMHGFGRVRIEEDEPVFHAEWEKIIFALGMARIGWVHNQDEWRHAIENIDPVQYLAAQYYERWLISAEDNLLKKGMITKEEYDARIRRFSRNRKTPLPRTHDPERLRQIVQLIRYGSSTRREQRREAKFRVGDHVVARNMNPLGHTRLPRYVRGKQGIIAKVYGVFVLPDTNAHGKGENAEYVYNVCFDANELWGTAAEEKETVHIDLWESYLQSPYVAGRYADSQPRQDLS